MEPFSSIKKPDKGGFRTEGKKAPFLMPLPAGKLTLVKNPRISFLGEEFTYSAGSSTITAS